MKEETREFIIQITFILSAFMFIFMLFFGLGYIIYHSEVQDQQIYNTCIDTCERVFQEQKLIDCMQTCNQIIVKNKTVGGIG